MMPPRIRIRFSSQSLAYRPRQAVQWRYQKPTPLQWRHYADTHTPGSDLGKPPKTEGDAPEHHNAINQSEVEEPSSEQLPHVSEESAAMSKSMGEEGPDVNQGTPVREAVEGDKKFQSSLPKVMQDAIRKDKPQPEPHTDPSATPSQGQKRSFSTSTRSRSSDLQYRSDPSQDDGALESEFAKLSQQQDAGVQADQQALEHVFSQEQLRSMLEEEAANGEDGTQMALKGVKFGAPDVSEEKHLRKRYDTVVDQVTNLIMRHGLKAKAQKDMSIILSHLRTSPPPRPSSNRPIPLLEIYRTTTTALPLHPTLYLTVAIDSIAPLLRIRSMRGAAGGGMALSIPQPLSQRQRRRTAIQWIIEAVSRRARTSGRASMSPFPKRFAEEVVSIVEGRSGLWDKRGAIHKLGVGARTNVGFSGGKQQRRGF